MKKKKKSEGFDWSKRKRLSGSEKVRLGLFVVLALAAFFYLATSTFNNWIKAGSIIVLLSGSGMIIQRLARIEGYYGLLILRGTRGFGAMEYFSKHFGKTARDLADFGLSLSFGALYSYWLFGRTSKKKFFAHLIALGAFFLILQTGIALQFGEIAPAVFLLNMSFGLLALGTQSLLFQGARILTSPESAAGVTLIVPGVTVPWEGIIAIIIAAGVHEIAHGILCRVEKLEVKNSGAIFLGVLPIGAFVEPNEEKMKRIDVHKKRRILVAGTTSNFFLFLIFTLLTQIVAFGLIGMTNHIQVVGVAEEGSAFGILEENEVIVAIQGIPVKSSNELVNEVQKFEAGAFVPLTTNLGEKHVRLMEGKKMGIFLQDAPSPSNAFVFGLLMFVFIVFNLTALINFALAVINILPIFLTDGYRMVYEESRIAFPSPGDQKAQRIAVAVGIISVLLLLINFIPSFR
ncbi:site-2 protease family protein [Candidatus Micrarchaeota archaeon]|nr:site-2 protease family protein [Candidatus Micrarchaeota archaeon]